MLIRCWFPGIKKRVRSAQRRNSVSQVPTIVATDDSCFHCVGTDSFSNLPFSIAMPFAAFSAPRNCSTARERLLCYRAPRRAEEDWGGSPLEVNGAPQDERTLGWNLGAAAPPNNN